MYRRTLLAAAAGTMGATAGCLNRMPFVGSSVDPSFERVSADLAHDEDPQVSVDDGTVTVRGTVEHGSSECGTVDLAHAAYERSQARLDLLVVAADDGSGFGGCTDDLVHAGYRLEVDAPDGLRRVSATEHHVFGDTYSTTVDGLDR
ncbi:hypothetical protein [Natrarchaeobaculum aegyptiacum]|uniref:Uncharacterized protein n=1 Tax=Natrarchaeobaculum aegyptiacum TaxID=745377 RepID=A0A2Z2HXA1_9EURY|nr:hypothetical protein [Natrarchaeobaculum aegyptiacum]ARS91900.1 hypothetical protein B1756_16490 [Natrarchaeobaculum aegyptiacum]